MKPTLLLLAAGMGSRYGGLKQLDGLGPNGETIMDYSIYDAIKAGFGKIVFVIRKDFEKDFKEKILSKYEGHIPAKLVFQSLDALPEGFTVPEGREKPWGTNHAVMMAKDVIKEPFCVINCDDFYNRDSFMVLGKFLAELPENAKNTYAMVGFRVGNTLSENGTVARGVCSTDESGLLTTVVERTEIMRVDGKVCYKDEQGHWVAIADNTPVSMNMWGFTPDYFEYSEAYFKEFLADEKNRTNLKSEEGIYVTEIARNSGAEDAGIKQGDIIKKVDNIKIETSSDLTLAIGSKRPGDKVAITYIRNGKENKVTVSLKDQKGNTSLRSKADLSVSEKIGGEFEVLSDRVKVSYGLNSGVIAKNIVDGGELSKIGVVDNYIIMEINGKPVNSQKDIENILKNYKGTVSVVYLDEYGRITRKGFVMP